MTTRPDQSLNAHPATQPTRNHRVRYYVGPQLLWREPLPRLFDYTSSLSRPFQNTTLDTAVLDSVVHCGTTITGINAKPVERQHGAPLNETPRYWYPYVVLTGTLAEDEGAR